MFEEIAVSQCSLNGSLSVTFNARDFLEARLADSDYLEDIEHILECFDRTTKQRFSTDQEPQYIKFGSMRDNDPACNIRYGQLKVEGQDMAKFFQPSVECIVSAVLKERELARRSISHVILVGGFSANDWLYKQVVHSLAPSGLQVARPDNYVNKAVSDGAIAFYLNRCVRSRVAKYTYGQFCTVPYDPSNPEHVRRVGDTFTSYAEERRLNGAFDVILGKGTQVEESTEFREEYRRKSLDRDFFLSVPFKIYRYQGQLSSPAWKDEDPEMFSLLCTVEMDFSHLKLEPRRHVQSGRVTTYYELTYGIILSLGLTELKAQIA